MTTVNPALRPGHNGRAALGPEPPTPGPTPAGPPRPGPPARAPEPAALAPAGARALVAARRAPGMAPVVPANPQVSGSTSSAASAPGAGGILAARNESLARAAIERFASGLPGHGVDLSALARDVAAAQRPGASAQQIELAATQAFVRAALANAPELADRALAARMRGMPAEDRAAVTAALATSQRTGIFRYAEGERLIAELQRRPPTERWLASADVGGPSAAAACMPEASGALACVAVPEAADEVGGACGSGDAGATADGGGGAAPASPGGAAHAAADAAAHADWLHTEVLQATRSDGPDGAVDVRAGLLAVSSPILGAHGELGTVHVTAGPGGSALDAVGAASSSEVFGLESHVEVLTAHGKLQVPVTAEDPLAVGALLSVGHRELTYHFDEHQSVTVGAGLGVGFTLESYRAGPASCVKANVFDLTGGVCSLPPEPVPAATVETGSSGTGGAG